MPIFCTPWHQYASIILHFLILLKGSYWYFAQPLSWMEAWTLFIIASLRPFSMILWQILWIYTDWCLSLDSFLLYSSQYFVYHVHNYANPVYRVATICHQVRWLRWGHPSLFHIATSLLIWYKMFCVRDVSYRLIWMELINMFSEYAQSGTHGHFNW